MQMFLKTWPYFAAWGEISKSGENYFGAAKILNLRLEISQYAMSTP